MAAFCGGFSCSRNTLFVVNILYMVVACILIGMAAYAKAIAVIVDYSIVGGIIACGVILLVIAGIGLFGTAMHHQVTLFVYMIALVLLFIIQFSVACACLASNTSQQQTVFEIGWKGSSWTAKDQMQKNYDCCGATKNSQNDILPNDTVTGIGHPPCANSTYTCVNSTDFCCTGIHHSNKTTDCDQEACWDRVKGDVSNAIHGVGIVGLLFSFTELLGIWMAYRYRNLKDPNVNPNAFL